MVILGNISAFSSPCLASIIATVLKRYLFCCARCESLVRWQIRWSLKRYWLPIRVSVAGSTCKSLTVLALQQILTTYCPPLMSGSSTAAALTMCRNDLHLNEVHCGCTCSGNWMQSVVQEMMCGHHCNATHRQAVAVSVIQNVYSLRHA